jgi:DNA invertase Pin-like site-specific DNA recombinase
VRPPRAQRAGIEHAKQRGDRAYIGRKPSYTRDQFNKVRDMLRQEAVSIAQIARKRRSHGVSLTGDRRSVVVLS